MLSVTRQDASRVDIRVHGPIDAAQMRDGLAALVTAAEGIEDGVMLYTLDEFPWPTAGALAVEFGHLPRMLRLMQRFRRCAVLSDAAWLRKVAEWEGALLPGLEIRGFDHNARAEAEAWLDEVRPTP
jgi:hypothetical protein